MWNAATTSSASWEAWHEEHVPEQEGKEKGSGRSPGRGHFPCPGQGELRGLRLVAVHPDAHHPGHRPHHGAVGQRHRGRAGQRRQVLLLQAAAGLCLRRGRRALGRGPHAPQLALQAAISGHLPVPVPAPADPVAPDAVHQRRQALDPPGAREPAAHGVRQDLPGPVSGLFHELQAGPGQDLQPGRHPALCRDGPVLRPAAAAARLRQRRGGGQHTVLHVSGRGHALHLPVLRHDPVLRRRHGPGHPRTLSPAPPAGLPGSVRRSHQYGLPSGAVPAGHRFGRLFRRGRGRQPAEDVLSARSPQRLHHGRAGRGAGFRGRDRGHAAVRPAVLALLPHHHAPDRAARPPDGLRPDGHPGHGGRHEPGRGHGGGPAQGRAHAPDELRRQ